MMIEFQGQRAVFSQVVGVEDAEQLLAWLLRTPGAHADFQYCTHLHPANLQVLMAAATPVCVWPEDPALAAWLRSALRQLPPPASGSGPHQGKRDG
jgi:hypothetical protein